MRFLSMWNPFEIVGSEIASEQQIEDALRELYNAKPHVTATIGVALAGLSACMTGAVWAGALATLIALVCLLFRIVIERRFVVRGPGPLDPKWTRLFVIGAVQSSFGFGLSGAILFYDTSLTTQIIIIGVACAIVQGAAGRAYMMPGTAFIYIACIMGMMGTAALADGNYILAPAFPLYFYFLASFIMKMVKNRVRQLQAEQTTDRLLKEITEKNELLRIANDALATKAYEDSLTGLANRRKFDLCLDESLAAAQRDGSPISLMMIDVDHFKSFNDTYGHQSGDECLQQLSKAISATISVSGSLVARYGGEEFVVILPGQTLAQAKITAEGVRVAVWLTDLDTLPNSPPRQTVSIGLVSCDASSQPTHDAIIAAADAALYKAKKQGRNRVCVHATQTETEVNVLPFGTAHQP
ncbi:GGDEF domain-containing protein [Hoeflea sp. AS60]|uniref:sensor domain-containing diguanylate cyclase n=1 Tax=Hoeflea sp. AS60 TaxID=3135780 RepID=UPI00317D9B18